MGTQMLELLRVFLVVAGLLGALWGVYDNFGDGQQSSMGTKKIIGGIAFAVIAGVVMTWAVNQVKDAEAKAKLPGMRIPPAIVYQIPKGRM